MYKPRCHAYHHVVLGMYRNTGEGFRIGCILIVGAAFGGMNGIITGVAWVRAMEAFRVVLAALLQNFLRTGAKTCEEISAYMEKARKHPTCGLTFS